ncbi:MAG TPA: 23S rRNA (adenine(2503)-C(2))-methyltransferase RlmN [Polyangiaceae bacterium]
MSSIVPPLARTPEEWKTALEPLGGRAFHAKQVFRWVQARSVLEPQQMTDLPLALRESLASLELPQTLVVADERKATDGTRKLLVRTRDAMTVETVLIPGVTGPKGRLPSPVPDMLAMEEGDDDEEDGSPQPEDEPVRVTQCISTQVGCAQGCVFCASGVAGLKRNLGADEIIAQVLLARASLGEGERLSNVVYMGMGEPLANYEATARSLRILTHPEGIGLSARRITVSTSGLVPEIARLGADFGGKVGLAISLHAADDETRSRLMPINKKYPLAKLLEALRAYPLPARKRITIEYTLVAGKNDQPTEARKLATLLRGLAVKVNLIPMNPIEASTLGPPDMSGVLAFQRILCDAGYSCFIRRRRGDDVAAACGQLALLGAKPKVRVNRG